MNNFIKYIANIATNNNDDKNIILNTKVDDDLLYLIKYHQLSPYLHYFKKSITKNVTTINEQILLKCQEQYFQNICKNLLYINFLKQSSPPPFVLVKGLVSSKLLYSDEGLRTFNDLDIFIKQKDYADWMMFLTDYDFTRYGNVSDNFPDKIIKKYNFAQHFINKENNIAIDLHTNISNKMHPFQFDIAQFFTNTYNIEINGLQVSTFTSEYMIIYLLYHTFKHYYFKILWFVDLHKAFKILGYNDHELHKLILKYNLTSIFDYYLTISKDLFGNHSISPDSILLKKYKNRTNKYINESQVISGEYSSENSLNRLLLPMYFIPKLKLKGKYLFNQFFPPAEILPEYYEDNFRYLKNRINRIRRLL